MVSSKHNCIQVFKEFNSFEILVAAEFICNPFSILLTIIKIKHRSNCIHTKTVNMALLHPVKGIGDQEVLDLRTTIIIDLGSPVRMLTLSRICMFIYSCSVKIGKSMGIFREVGRYPIKNNAYLLTVKIINKIFEILRSSITGCRCIIAGYLISPGTVKRMFGNTHKLNMCIPHLFNILGKLRCQFSVGIETIFILLCLRMLHPGTWMYLINGHGTCIRIKILTVLHPGNIFPFIVGNICDPGCSSWTQLSFIGIRVCLVKLFTMSSRNVKFIQLSDLGSRYKCLINTNRSNFLHRILLIIPSVEFTYNRNRLRIRRPHCEINSFFPVLRIRMSPQFSVNIIMRALTKKILVKLRKLQFLSHFQVPPFIVLPPFIPQLLVEFFIL